MITGESTSAQYFLTAGELKKFTQALTQALYDHAIEEQRAIRYYYDADIVVWMVLGLFGKFTKYRDVKEDLIRALLSAGFLGEVHILRPHALELRNRILNVEEQAVFIRKLKNPTAFRKRISDYFGEARVLESLDRLDEALRKARSPEERVEAFVKEVKRSGPQTFIAYELARGNWQERLVTLNRTVLRFEHFGEDIEKIIESFPEIWHINDAIVQAREEEALARGFAEPQQRSVSDLNDAIALATLSRLMTASQYDPSVPEARFHTNTPRLLQAAMSPSLTHLFRYPVSQVWDKDKSWGTDLVFRSTDYYILRASFKALHFTGMFETSEGDDVTIAELDDVRRELVNAWRQYDQPIDRADAEKQLLSQVEGIRIGGKRTLRDTLVELERASFLARLLKRYKTSKSVSSFLKEQSKTDVFAAEETDLAAARLLEEAKTLTTDLTGKLTGMARWFEPTREIILAVNQLAKAKDNRFEITNAVRDLGLVRWGVDPDQDHLERVVRYARDLFSHVETQANHAASDLSREVEHPPRGEGHALANAALLWQLGCFELVTRLINRYEDLHGLGLLVSLQIMRKAARLRSNEESSIGEHQHQMCELREAVTRVKDQSTRGRHLIGLAYITFYIAFSLGDRDHPLHEVLAEHPADSGAMTWARESFEFADQAAKLLSDDPLGRAFAINHAVYVGVLYRLYEDGTRDYLDELRALSTVDISDRQRVWHYRFADTVAIAAVRTAYDAWKSVPDGESRIPVSVCSLLAEAENILKTASPYYGDGEIPQHRREIKRLQDLVKCLPPAGFPPGVHV